MGHFAFAFFVRTFVTFNLVYLADLFGLRSRSSNYQLQIRHVLRELHHFSSLAVGTRLVHSTLQTYISHVYKSQNRTLIRGLYFVTVAFPKSLLPNYWDCCVPCLCRFPGIFIYFALFSDCSSITTCLTFVAIHPSWQLGCFTSCHFIA